MAKIFPLILFLISLFPFAAFSAPAAWQVEGEKGALTIFGTFHRLPEGTDWLSDSLEERFQSSRLLVIEAKNNQITDDYLGYILGQPGVAKDRKSLKNRLGDEDFAAFMRRVAPFGYKEEDVIDYRPWFAITLLGKLGGDEVGLEFDLGPEQTLSQMAAEDGIEILGLESPAQQTRFYSELSKDVELAWLKTILARGDKPGTRAESLFGFWIEGNLEAIGERVFQSYKEIPTLYDVFIKDRNENWVEQLEYLMKEGGEIFVAVGAAHLVGEDSVLKLLQKEGYRVTRIQ